MTPLHRAWTDGVIQGLREYAWWHASVQYVGDGSNPGPTGCWKAVRLDDAIAKAEAVWADETWDESCHELKPMREEKTP